MTLWMVLLSTICFECCWRLCNDCVSCGWRKLGKLGTQETEKQLRIKFFSILNLPAIQLEHQDPYCKERRRRRRSVAIGCSLTRHLQLQSFLPAVHFAHCLLLVESVYTLIAASLHGTFLMLRISYMQLLTSLNEFESLYGHDNMSYSVHLLHHLARTVREWGPSQGTLNFMFHNSNGFQLDLFNDTQGVSVHMCRTFALYRLILTAKYLSDKSESIKYFLSKCISQHPKAKRV